jgi:hypothetical protein
MNTKPDLEKVITDAFASEYGPGSMAPITPDDAVKVAAESAAQHIAQQIRSALVCCDVYARIHQDAERDSLANAIGRATLNGTWHERCYRGEEAARLAEKSAQEDRSELPDFLASYLDRRCQERAAGVKDFLDRLTLRERALVRDFAVMGYVQGCRHPEGAPHPKDSAVLDLVTDACMAFSDLYPAVARIIRTGGQER